HILVRADPRKAPDIDTRAIEDEIVRATRRWEEGLKGALIEAHGEERAMAVLRDYAGAFPAAYRDEESAATAVADIGFMRALGGDRTFAVSLYRPEGADDRALRLRVYRLGASVPLSASLPVLENMGL